MLEKYSKIFYSRPFRVDSRKTKIVLYIRLFHTLDDDTSENRLSF